MGKSCTRFTQLTDVRLEHIGQTFSRDHVEEFIERYEKCRA
jgi:hypothetical protein